MRYWLAFLIYLFFGNFPVGLFLVGTFMIPHLIIPCVCDTYIISLNIYKRSLLDSKSNFIFLVSEISAVKNRYGRARLSWRFSLKRFYIILFYYLILAKQPPSVVFSLPSGGAPPSGRLRCPFGKPPPSAQKNKLGCLWRR